MRSFSVRIPPSLELAAMTAMFILMLLLIYLVGCWTKSLSPPQQVYCVLVDSQGNYQVRTALVESPVLQGGYVKGRNIVYTMQPGESCRILEESESIPVDLTP